MDFRFVDLEFSYCFWFWWGRGWAVCLFVCFLLCGEVRFCDADSDDTGV